MRLTLSSPLVILRFTFVHISQKKRKRLRTTERFITVKVLGFPHHLLEVFRNKSRDQCDLKNKST